jgi:hypothetical protein
MPGSRPMLSFRGAPPHYEHDPQRRPGRAREIRSAGKARRTMPNSQLEEKLSYFQKGRAAERPPPMDNRGFLTSAVTSRASLPGNDDGLRLARFGSRRHSNRGHDRMTAIISLCRWPRCQPASLLHAVAVNHCVVPCTLPSLHFFVPRLHRRVVPGRHGRHDK